MNAFQVLNDSELQSIEGGNALVVAAFVVVGIGITVAVGAIAIKSASDFVDATQQQNSGGRSTK